MKTNENVLDTPNPTDNELIAESSSDAVASVPAPAKKRPLAGWLIIPACLVLGFLIFRIAVVTHGLHELLDETQAVLQKPRL